MSIPDYTLRSITAYVQEGIPPSDFLEAVLTNNLKVTFMLADDSNRPAIQEIVAYCRWQIPAVCWGSPENVAAWVQRFAEERGS